MTKFRVIVITLIIIFLFSVTSIVYFYTDLLWFNALGFQSIFTKIILVKLATGLAFGLFSWLFLVANILIARRLAPKLYYLTPNLSLQSIIQQVKPYMDRFFTPILFAGSLVLSAIIGLGMASQWDIWLGYFNQVTSPIKDPLFHHSISFYFFTMPILENLQQFAFFILFITILVSLAIHLLDGSIVHGLGRQTFAPHVKAHLSWLAGLLMLDLATMWYLNIFNLLYSPTGNVVYGASFTDVNAVMPSLKILVVISIISAIILLINIVLKGWRLPIIALSLTGAVWLLALNVYPALIQAYQVSPNEIAKEKPYIKLNIAGTRNAYNLNHIKAKPFPALNNLDPNKIAANKATLENISSRLGIDISEFGDLAIKSTKDIAIPMKCGVIMSSAVISKKNAGEKIENILMAVCNSVVRNFLNLTSKGKSLEEPIVFQGMTAHNKGLVKAFEETLKKKITIPSKPEAMGAFGMAILTQEEMDGKKTNFNADKLGIAKKNKIKINHCNKDCISCGVCYNSLPKYFISLPNGKSECIKNEVDESDVKKMKEVASLCPQN